MADGENTGQEVQSAEAPVINVERFLTKGKMARDDIQRPRALELLKEFVSQVELAGEAAGEDPVSFAQRRIEELDEMLNLQINEVLHHPEFQATEATWRGFHYLVFKTHTSARLKLRVLNIAKKDLLKDLERAPEFDQSAMFKLIYEEEYGTYGGAPYSCLMGDYEFSNHPQDMELLTKMSAVASAAHAPFITAAHPKLFNLDSFSDLGVPRDLSKVFESTEMVKWRSFRDSEDSRYVVLTLPHILMRLPYGPDTAPVEGMNFKEYVDGPNNSHFCWGNASYALAERITNAFYQYGWTAAIRGVEGGGLVEGLPAYTFKTTDGDVALKCPTEVAITDRREKELSDLGFIGLCHCKGKDYASFFGSQTSQKPKTYSAADSTASASLSARLPYILAASRFAHYIKVLMRDKIGSFMTKSEVQKYLTGWIANYVLLSDEAPQNIKAKYPLREARVDVYEIPGQPGSYRSVVYLRPHFQLEDLNASLRLVANLPPPAA